MKQTTISIQVKIFTDYAALEADDRSLLETAMQATGDAYAPYSDFRVGVAVRLGNGKVITGSNQENASYPAGICAERVALSAASAVYPGIPVTVLALTYINKSGISNLPISPCGICRQSLAEYEQRFEQPIRLIMSGKTGEVYMVNQATDLLPLAFSGKEIKTRL